jgi:hypothetical protein
MTDPALVPKGPVPINEFNKVYCLRCGRAECSRSAGSNLSFTNRVLNWKHDLFEAPPRADENDPMFADIRAKKFISASDNIQQVSPTVIQVPVQIEQESKPNPLGVKIVEEQSVEVEPVPVQEQPVEQIQEIPPTVRMPSNRLLNTKYNQGTMVGNPNPQPSKEVVIAPGGTFSFGEDEK